MIKTFKFAIIVVVFFIFTGVVRAQSEDVNTDFYLNTDQLYEDSESTRTGPCQDLTDAPSGWDCQHSEQFYSSIRATAYGCLCKKREEIP